MWAEYLILGGIMSIAIIMGLTCAWLLTQKLTNKDRLQLAVCVGICAVVTVWCWNGIQIILDRWPL